MPGKLLTRQATVLCPHGGQGVLQTSDTVVKLGQAVVALEADTHLVNGCGFMRGNQKSPCVRITWQAGAGTVKINGTRALVESSRGTCASAEGTVQGMAIVGSAGQTWGTAQ